MITRNFTPNTKIKRALLINPPVHDCSDFKLEYCQPTGLMKIGSHLLKYGVEVSMIDCLKDISMPEALGHVSRDQHEIPMYHFGKTFSDLEKQLSSFSDSSPQHVYISAFATYWHPSIAHTINLIRKKLPASKVIVGGIYPTLMPEHAQNHLKADVTVVGSVEAVCSEKINTRFYDDLAYLGLKPYNGCPHNCSYCAQQVLNNNRITSQSIQHVLGEIETACNNGIHQFYIFSENFLYNRDHFEALLEGIIQRELDIKINAPKGMEPSRLDGKILKLMKRAGWHGLRLALESSDDLHRVLLGRRHNSNTEYSEAIAIALDSGFSPEEIGTFLLYGTPLESIETVRHTADYIFEHNSYIVPMALTPVPRSALYEKYYDYLKDKNLTELMGRLYPFAELNGFRFGDYLELESYFAELNNLMLSYNNCPADLDFLETRLNGVFMRSEMAFAMFL